MEKNLDIDRLKRINRNFEQNVEQKLEIISDLRGKVEETNRLARTRYKMAEIFYIFDIEMKMKDFCCLKKKLTKIPKRNLA